MTILSEDLEVKTVPAKMDIDCAAFEKELDEYLQNFNIAVTLETLADAKKTATELNKLAGRIDQARKDAIAEVSAPIKAFDTWMKSQRDKALSSRTAIKEQTDKFMAEVVEQARQLISQRQTEKRDELEIDSEFRVTPVDDLAMVSAVTKSGKLAKNTRDAVDARVGKDLALKLSVESRLNKLASESYRAGLKVPLKRASVNSFLFADDHDYNAQLQSIIESEQQRQQEYETQAQAEREQEEVKRQKEEALAQAKRDEQAEVEERKDSAEEDFNDTPTKQPEDTASGIATWHVNVIFTISAPNKFTAQQIADASRKKMNSIGVANIDSLQVDLA